MGESTTEKGEPLRIHHAKSFDIGNNNFLTVAVVNDDGYRISVRNRDKQEANSSILTDGKSDYIVKQALRELSQLDTVKNLDVNRPTTDVVSVIAEHRTEKARTPGMSMSDLTGGGVREYVAKQTTAGVHT